MNPRRRRTPMAVAARRHHRHGGFTLVELMVAIGIIALLAGILVPVVVHARKAAASARSHRDLETIRVALDSYKNDWGMYPPIAPLPATINNASDPTSNINNADGKPMLMYDGAHALYTALMLRGNARMSHSGAIAGGGRSYGPYLNAEQVKSISDPTAPAATIITNGEHCLLADSYGNPILYVPAYPVPLNYTITAIQKTPPNKYVADSTNPAGAPAPFYDFHAIPQQIPDPNTSSSAKIVPFHNSKLSNSGLDEMRVLLGDGGYPGSTGMVPANATAPDGVIDTTPPANEQAAMTGPYLLWTAGPDGRFGINETTQKCDDICNFEVAGPFRE
jgi:prepilin-type N-terminal cleavage/methylation domain-containing protein